MSLSGLGFYGHDLGGFHGEMPSRQLLLRWLQHGVFEPRFTIHSWNEDGSATMPWSYPDIMDSVRRIFAERKKLLPYLYSCAFDAVENEIPMNAPPLLYYDDEALYEPNSSMMVGKDILVGFVFDEDKDTASIYLPKGESWYLGDKLFEGGQTVEVKIPAGQPVPYFVRSGCVLPTDEAEYGFNCKKETVFTVYPKERGEYESFFFDDDGESFRYKDNDCVKLHFFVSCDENHVTVEYENTGKMPCKMNIRLCGGDKRRLEVKSR